MSQCTRFLEKQLLWQISYLGFPMRMQNSREEATVNQNLFTRLLLFQLAIHFPKGLFTAGRAALWADPERSFSRRKGRWPGKAWPRHTRRLDCCQSLHGAQQPAQPACPSPRPRRAGQTVSLWQEPWETCPWHSTDCTGHKFSAQTLQDLGLSLALPSSTHLLQHSFQETNENYYDSPRVIKMTSC